MTLLIMFLYILFILSAIVLVVVILLQEGKGGGLTAALGTSGQQTFGVGASGINKFTGWTGVVFLASALAIHYCNRLEGSTGAAGQFGQPQIQAPEPGAPGAGGQTPPPADAPPSTPPTTPPNEAPK